MAEIVTILVRASSDTTGGDYRKSIDNEGGLGLVAPQRMPVYHRVREVEVSDPKGFFALLNEQAKRPLECFIRGRLIEAMRGTDKPCRRSLEHFDDVARHLHAFDLDGITLPEDLDWKASPADAIRWVIADRFPGAFRDAACVYKFSSSMGIKEGLRAHLWFWSTEPKTSSEMREWVLSWGWEEVEQERAGRTVRRRVNELGVDLAVFNPVQPHFLADPEIRGKDPFRGRARAGFIEGGEVSLESGPFVGELPEDAGRPFEADTSLGKGPKFRDKAHRGSVIGFVNATVSIAEALAMAGYIHAGRNRWLSPSSVSGSPGVVVMDGHAYSHHDGDPLNDGHWHDAYDVLELYEKDNGVAGDEIRFNIANYAEEVALRKINEDYAMFRGMGKVRIAHRYPDKHHKGSYLYEFLSVADAKSWAAKHQIFKLQKKKVNGETEYHEAKPLNPIVRWQGWSERKDYTDITFTPRDLSKINPEILNTWQGWPIQGRPGKWDLMKRLILEGFCQGNQEHYLWLMDMLAAWIQHPEERYGVALILRGEEGVGKGRFAEWYGKLFGAGYKPLSNSKVLTNNFNAWIDGCLLMFADELTWGGNVQDDGVLRNLITEKTIQIERKGMDPVVQPNYVHMIAATNEKWAVPAGRQARRYFVLDVSDRFMGDRAFFNALEEQMKTGGLEAMMHELSTREITTDQREAPRTKALLDLNERSMDEPTRWAHEILVSGDLLLGYRDKLSDFDPEHGHQWLNCAEVLVDPQELHQAYLLWRREHSYRGHPQSQRMLIRKLREIAEAGGGALERTQRRVEGSRVNLYSIPALAALREGFDHIRRMEGEWDPIDTGEGED